MTEPVITIVSYQPWMREQIISLTGQEYPFMKDWFETRFHALYESDFLKNRNGIVVALQNNTQVVACISYIYWPLSYRGGLLNSFQMVGLLVDPAVRGKGLFSRVLAAMDTELKSLSPDVVFGFPVEASKKGFLKQGWKNNFNLQWYASPVSAGGIFNRKFTGKGFDSTIPTLLAPNEYIQTAPLQEFWTIREDFFPDWKTWSKLYEVKKHKIQFIFRIQKVKGMNVALLGRIYSGSATVSEISAAIKQWKKDLRKNGSVVAVMAAINENCISPDQVALRKSMFRTGKEIIVIVKTYNNHTAINNNTQWNIMRGDMETW